jgi:hypothetical protein
LYVINTGGIPLEKLLNTENINNIYDSLSEILEVSKESIRHYIVKNKFDIINSDVNQIDLKKFFRFLQKENNREKVIPVINSITISHLTTRISEPTKVKSPLYNLFDTLLLDTDLSRFFQDYGIIFKEENNKVVVTCDEKIINWDDYSEPVALMVKRRLEGNKVVVVDKCVNGFLFNGPIYKNGNVNHILYYPEILENILRIVKKHYAVEVWVKKAVPYILTFKVNIKDVVFDSCDKLNNKQKTFRILKHCLIFLSEKLLNEWDEYHNPILRLRDNLNVESNKIINIRKVEKQLR